MTDPSHGLNCPRCGGIVPVPEGQAIVVCPFCEMRSVVRGERGLRRYQVTCKVQRPAAEAAFRKFLASSMAIARDARGKAQLSEAFIAYLPFWMVWGRAMGYALGEEQVGSGDNRRWVPREVRIAEEMSWNGAACDVGEFGVNQVPLNRVDGLDPFQAEALHRAGLVFEPVGSVEEARQVATAEFEERIRQKGKLDRISQLFVRVTRQRMGLVYYPLWVMRYLYRGRSFQVVVDGDSGQVLYGKAPGNTFYRAGMLVFGMLAGSVLAVDVSSLLLYFLSGSDSDSSEGLLVAAGAAFLGGLGLMVGAYQKFRYGEQYEYRSAFDKGLASQVTDFTGNLFKPQKMIKRMLSGGKR